MSLTPSARRLSTHHSTCSAERKLTTTALGRAVSGPAAPAGPPQPPGPSASRSGLTGNPEPDQGPQRAEPVLPGDLLAFVELAAVVGDRHLVDAIAATKDLGRDLRLEVKAVGDDRDAVEDLAVEELVAGLHVRDRRVVENVGDQRQHPVTDPVPEQHVLSLAGEAASVDNLGLATEHRVQELRPILRVIFEVCVLDEDQVTPRHRQPGPDPCTLALVDVVAEDAHGRVLERGQDLVGAVGRAVVDDNDLEFHRETDLTHTPNDLGDGRALVEDGHDHREEAVLGARVGPVRGGERIHAPTGWSGTTRPCEPALSSD